jgi:predicted metal-dependent hydrolase
MVTKATHTVWESGAGSRFLKSAEHAARELIQDAREMDDLARILRRHAGHVRDHLEDLAELERRAKNIVGTAADDVEETGKWSGEHVPW